MNCRDVLGVIEAFFDGELRGAEMREVARHLAACPPCEARAVELEQGQEALQRAVAATADGGVDARAAWAAVAAELDTADPTFRERVRAFLDSLQIPRVPVPVLIGGLAVVLVALLFWRDGEQLPGEPGAGGAQQVATGGYTRIDELKAPGNVQVWNAPDGGATVIWVDEEGLSVEQLDP